MAAGAHILLAAAVLIPPPARAEAEERAGPLSWLIESSELSATLRSEWAWGWDRAESQKLQFELEPELELGLPMESELTAVVRLRGDAFDKLRPGNPKVRSRSVINPLVRLGDNGDFELRELFLEATIGRTFLTLGKQQVVWGKADGLKVLDVVNPQDFREFILRDFEDSRTPLWTVNAEIPVREIVAQLIWIPDPTFHDIPPPGALYAFKAPRLVGPPPPPGVALDIEHPNRPKNLFFDSDAGLRLSSFWHGWDLTLNYLYHYADAPVLRRALSFPGGSPLVTVTPDYERTHSAGASFSNAFGNLTFRGEGGISTRRFFPTGNPSDTDGVFRSPEILYVLALDWYGFDETLLSFQFFQSILTRRQSGAFRGSVDNVITLLARRELLNDQLALEAMWLSGVDDGDGLVRAKITYELRDEISIWGGVDVFYGSARGLFGEFNTRDRFVLGVEFGI